MPIHEDRQVQHAASNGLQRSTSDYFVIDRAAFNQGENAKYDIEIRGGGYCPTLVARGPHAVVTLVHGTK